MKCLETEIKHLFLEKNYVNKTNSMFIFQKKRLLIIIIPAESMPAWTTSGGDCGSIMMPGEAGNDCTVICGS